MSILFKLNKNLSRYLFNSPNTFTFSLFNYLYNKFIINLDGADDEIKFFHKNGYLKPQINFKEETLQLKKLLDTNHKIDKQNSFEYVLNEDIINVIKNILNSKKDTSKFIKFNNYKNRFSYDLNNEKEIGLVRNTGLTGDILICSTPQCLHRASSPNNGKFRDMLFLSFAVTNEKQISSNALYKFEKDYFNDIWNCTSTLSKKLCKPKSFRKQISIFKKFIQNKIN